MDATFKDFLQSGRALLTDTKTPRKLAAVGTKLNPLKVGGMDETDPYKAFVKRVISEKPKKGELVKDLKRFIEGAEAQL